MYTEKTTLAVILMQNIKNEDRRKKNEALAKKRADDPIFNQHYNSMVYWIKSIEDSIVGVINGGGTNLSFPQNNVDSYIKDKVLAPSVGGWCDTEPLIYSSKHEMHILWNEFIERMESEGLYIKITHHAGKHYVIAMPDFTKEQKIKIRGKCADV